MLNYYYEARCSSWNSAKNDANQIKPIRKATHDSLCYENQVIYSWITLSNVWTHAWLNPNDPIGMLTGFEKSLKA